MLKKPLCVAVSAVALACVPSVAFADHGEGAFKNCTEAYAAGYSDIPESSPRYGDHLDRDQDGVGCDQPPAGFKPAKDGESAKEGGATEQGEPAKGEAALAETGGDSATAYLAGGGLVVLLAGGGVVAATRRRRASR